MYLDKLGKFNSFIAQISLPFIMVGTVLKVRAITVSKTQTPYVHGTYILVDGTRQKTNGKIMYIQ